jgi:hypothetical protein
MMVLGHVAEIWRYPVRGLQGEKLAQSPILKTGVAGDHVYVLRSTDSEKILDPVVHPSSRGATAGLQGMLEFTATLSGDPMGEHEVDIKGAGQTVYSSRKTDDTRVFSEALGLRLELVKYPRIVETRVRAGRTLYLLTDSSLGELRRRYPAGDPDPRRFRPNIMVATEGRLKEFAEEGWLGKELDLGDQVRVSVEKANARCKIVTLKQAGVEADGGILQTIQGRTRTTWE